MKNKLSYRGFFGPLCLLLSAVVLTVLLVLPLSAEGAESGTWLITSADGSTRYSDSEYPFSAPEEGATYRLLADRLTWKTSLNVTSDASYTIDLSGREIVTEPGYNITVITFGGSQNVRVLMDGTTFSCAADQSVLFNVSDHVTFTADGGENGFFAYCPCFLNAIGSADCSATVKNGRLYKNSGNVKALICARGASSVSVENSSVYGDNDRSPLFLNDCASMKISASAVIGIGEKALFCDTDNGVLLTVAENSVISGTLNGISSVAAEPGTRFTDLRTSMLKTETVIREMPETLSFTYSKIAYEKIVEETVSVPFTYLVTGKGIISSERTEDSVWMILDSEGSPTYCNDLYSPFYDVAADVTLVLLKNVDVPFFPTIGNVRAFSVDLSGCTVKQICRIPTLTAPALLTFSGQGTRTLDLTRATVVAEGTFLSAPLVTGISVSAEDAFVFASSLFLCPRASLAVSGGYFSGSGVSYGINAGSLTAEHTRIHYDSEWKPACRTEGDATFTDTLIYAPNYGGALAIGKDLTLDDRSPVYGSTEAFRIVVGVGNLFAGKVKAESSASVLFLEETTPYSILTFTYGEKGVAASVSNVAFTVVSASPLHGLKASFYFGAEVLLHLYVPETTARFASDFSIRISVDGILYEASPMNAVTREIDGELYEMFTYRYLYHNNIEKTAHCALVLCGMPSCFDIPLLPLLLTSAERSEGEQQKTIANYLAYTLRISGIEGADELLSPYADLLVKEKAELVEAEEITGIIRAAAFLPKECALEFAFAEGFSGEVTLTYHYDEKRKTVTADAGTSDTFTVPIYRTEPTDTFVFSYEKDGESKKISVSLLTFAAMSDGTLSADDLDCYVAYLVSLGGSR